MSGSFLYQWVLASPCGERMDAVEALNDASLCRLAGWLRREYDVNGTTGEVLGMCLVEGFSRFAREKQDFKTQDAREEPAEAGTTNEEGEEIS